MGLRVVILSAFLLFVSAGAGICLSGKDIIKLKQAGISDATIEVIVREKIVETAAFSVQEIIDIKESGVSEKTLQKLLEESSFLKGSKTKVYGSNGTPLRFTTAQDLIELKKSGVSDEVLEAIVTYNSRHSTDAEKERALLLMRNMGIVVSPSTPKD